MIKKLYRAVICFNLPEDFKGDEIDALEALLKYRKQVRAKKNPKIDIGKLSKSLQYMTNEVYSDLYTTLCVEHSKRKNNFMSVEDLVELNTETNKWSIKKKIK